MNKDLGSEFRKFTKALTALPLITIGVREGDGKPVRFTKDIHFSEGFDLAIRLISEQCVRDRKKLMFIGNGGSAAIAGHQALDFSNGLKIKTLTFNDPAFLTCVANDFGYKYVFSERILREAERGDILVAISSSGKSQNILLAADNSILMGCWVITMSGFEADNPLRKTGDVNFYTPSRSYRIVEASHSLYLDFILEMILLGSRK